MSASSAKAPSLRTAIRALRLTALRVDGTGAPAARLPVALALALTALLALAAAPASAFVTHEFIGEITEVPATSGAPVTGPLVQPNSMTVDAGKLYVADGGIPSGRFDVFDPSSLEWLAQSDAQGTEFGGQGIAVGHGTAETQVYVGGGGESSAVSVYGAAGALLGSWNGSDTPQGEFGCWECVYPGSVAVDQSTDPLTAGHVYVTAPGFGVIDIFEPKAGGGERYLGQIAEREPGVPLAGSDDVAVDQSNGDLLVVEGGHLEIPIAVDVFEPTGPAEFTLRHRLTGTPAGAFGSVGHLSSLAVDSGSGEFYVAEGSGERGVKGAIYEFTTGGEFVGKITGRPGAGGVQQIERPRLALAVDPESHDVFVAERNGPREVIDVFGPDLVLPDVETGAATQVEPESAVLNGTVDPVEAGVAGCHFLWGTSEAFGRSAPCEPASVPDGNTPIPVRAALPELQPDTTYFFRLQAENAKGLNPGEPSQDRQFTTTGPGIRSESVSEVTAGSATLQASIDPDGAPTSYFFEYGTGTGYGTAVPIPPGSSIGSGSSPVEVGQAIQGLAPATTYHYRVVARSELAPGVFADFAGADQTFVTQLLGLPGLLDGRAWEQVSPPDKQGGALHGITEGGIVQAAADGDAVTYLSNRPVEADPRGSSNQVQLLSGRGPDGWSSVGLSPPYRETTNPTYLEYTFFSADLSRGLVGPIGPVAGELSAAASEEAPFIRSTFPPGEPASFCTSDCYRPLVTGCPEAAASCPPAIQESADVPAGTVFAKEGACASFAACGPEVLGASPDLSHVVVSSSDPLTGITPDGGPGALYEWSEGVSPAESIRLISRLPDGEPSGNPELGFQGAATSDERNAISEDGERVVWASAGHLYLRVNATRPQSGLFGAATDGSQCTEPAEACTIQLDEVQSGAPGGSEPAASVYQDTADEGSRIFFTDSQQLSSDSGASGSDLYEYDLQSPPGERLTDLTPPVGQGPAAVQGFLPGASRDGRYLYFVADGVLAANPGADDTQASPGDCQVNADPAATCNLYMLHAGSIAFIATLSGADGPSWGQPRNLTSRVSPDGRWLAFMSRRPLTGYDNRDAASGQADEEVFLFDAGTGRLVCASCNPTGARPHGREWGSNQDHQLYGGSMAGPWQSTDWLAANVPGWTSFAAGRAAYQSRYLSDSGRLFFNSSDALVPSDTNGQEDVYEYEPPAGAEEAPPADTCTTASSTYSPTSLGCTALISSGTSPAESAFLDASESGDDVFFLTQSQLAPTDSDTAFDLYDARVGGGFPQPTSPVECTGDACQRPAVPPNDATPGSLTFDGAGNLTECPKGKNLQKGKCVKRKAKKKHHKKSHRKHHKKKSKKSQTRADAHKKGGQT